METVYVPCGERSYDIIVRAGSLAETGPFAARVTGGAGKRLCCATTETVASLYLDTVAASCENAGFEVTTIVVPDGERYKTLDTYTSILTRLIEEGFERSSVMLPLGGGVIGDMAGFAAATFLRGIPFVQVPTTIVAQVDSSIGGKVAVNHPLGKNLIGSFYQPAGVWIDTRVLSTLSARDILSGLGEAVKHAVISDADFFTFLENNIEPIRDSRAPDEVMERFIARNCRIKADVVSADERETGLRAILNYGHTIGHAIETAAGYGRLSHGEAVMFGMIAAGRIAVRRKLMPEEDFRRQNSLLARAGVSADIADLPEPELLSIMKRDKKVHGGRIRFVLPVRIGEVVLVDDVTEEEIVDALRYCKRTRERVSD